MSLRQAEEWLVEENKNLKLIVISIVAIIIIAIFIYLLYDNEVSGNTAMEEREIADNYAINWHDDAVLCYVTMFDDNNNGKSNAWYYSYYSPATEYEVNNYTMYEELFVYVY